MWCRHLLAFAIGTVLLVAGAALVGDPSGPLLAWIPRWAVVLSIDFLWSFSYTFWPRRPKTSAPAVQARETVEVHK
jgi:hypothetical protein